MVDLIKTFLINVQLLGGPYHSTARQTVHGELMAKSMVKQYFSKVYG